MANDSLPLILQIGRPLRKLLKKDYKYKIEPFPIMTGLNMYIYAFYAKKENIDSNDLFYIVNNHYFYEGFKLVDKQIEEDEIKIFFEKKDEKIEFEIKMYRFFMLNRELGNFSFGYNDFRQGKGGFFTTIQVF